MAEGTRVSQLIETVSGLKQQQEAQQQSQQGQQQLLEDIVQQLRTMSARMDQMAKAQGKRPIGSPPNSPTRSVNGDQRHEMIQQEGNHPVQIKSIRLEFPRFNGDDPIGWVYKANQFFNFHNTPAQHRLFIASFHMEGKAITWYQELEETGMITSWEAFVTALNIRFGTSSYDDPMEALINVKQSSTVEIYKTRFESLSNRVRGLSDSHKLSCFLGGLKEEVRMGVRMLNPQNLVTAYGLARMQEENLAIMRRAWRPSPMGLQGRGITQAHQRAEGPSERAIPLQRLSPAQMKEKRDKGLCFKCDGKWGPDHRCAGPKLFLIEEEEEEYIEEPGIRDLIDLSEPQEGPAEEVGISLHAMVGNPDPKTMRVKIKVKGHTFIALIDTGSTHNFVHPRVVRRTGIRVTRHPPVGVSIADGSKIWTEGSCQNILIIIQGGHFTTQAYILQLGGCDVVLGIHWLSGLGPILWDFASLKMEFKQGNKVVLIKGMGVENSEVDSSPSFLQELRRAEEGLILQVWKMGPAQGREPRQIEQLLLEFPGVFEEPSGMPPRRPQDHAIILKEGTSPINVRPYRYPYYQKTEIEKIVNELLAMGTIRPSQSPFSSPVLLVRKADGSWRMCVDYRALNKETIKDKFPIPVVEELLDELHGSQIFSKLDLRSGFHQIRMREEDIPKTAFRTHEGHYEFLVMPFGLTNAPSTFQGLMNDIFRPYLRKFVLVFFDDILVYSPTEEEHNRHLRSVLETLVKHQLVAKRSKCKFACKEIEYLGHIVSGQGVQADPNKVVTMVNWPRPKTLKALRGFLGLTGYYRRFIKGYGGIAGPLTRLLKKGAFQWDTAAEEAFGQLKKAVTTPPVLALPNFELSFTVECDASGVGLGAVLMQEGRPLAYYSKALKGRELALSTYEKEFLTLVSAVNKWRPYLLGQAFRVKTDQQSLKYLLEQRIGTPTQQKWLSKLIGYDFVVEYRAGKENLVADALSRQEGFTTEALWAISKPIVNWVEQLKESYETDPEIKDILQQMDKETVGSLKFQLKGEVLYYKHRIYISKNNPLKQDILSYMHDSPISGHTGSEKTLQRARKDFFWKGMKSDIQAYIKHCEVCQRAKGENTKPTGLLQPLPIPTRPWFSISMDFIEGLPKSNQFSAILVVVDRFTKYAHFIPLSHPYNAPKIAQLFLHNVIRLHGLPNNIISNRDPTFTSKFWGELFRVQGVKLLMSTAYHPQTDGQTEATNKTLEGYLRCYVGDNPKGWSNWLTMAEYCYNTSYHTSTKTTPFEATYGYPPPSIIDYVPGSTQVQATEHHLQDRTEQLLKIKQQLTKAQERQKKQADKGRTDREYKEGEWVYLKLQPFRQVSMQRKKNGKLAYKYFGPFKILKRVGSVAYQLDLPKEARIHNTFHVSLLKKWVGKDHPPEQWLPDFESTQRPQPKPAEILDRRTTTTRRKEKEEVLLRWEGQPAEDAVWVETEWLQREYPHLEVKVLEGEGSCDWSELNQREIRARRGEGEREESQTSSEEEEGQMHSGQQGSVLNKPTCTGNEKKLTCAAEMRARTTYVDGQDEGKLTATEEATPGSEIRTKETASFDGQEGQLANQQKPDTYTGQIPVFWPAYANQRPCR